jgi:hypothetical protein
MNYLYDSKNEFSVNEIKSVMKWIRISPGDLAMIEEHCKSQKVKFSAFVRNAALKLAKTRKNTKG